MGCNKANEFSGCYYFGFLPESGKVFQIAGHHAVSTRLIGAFEKYVVIPITRDFQSARRRHSVKQLFLMSCRSCCRRPLRIFSSGRASTSLYSSRIGREIYKRSGLVMASSRTPLQPGWLDSSGNQHICVNDEPKREH
jgi:hypothetical protein